MLSEGNKQIGLKVLWFAVMGVIIWLRVYDHISKIEGFTLFIGYTLIHVFIIGRLVFGNKMSV